MLLQNEYPDCHYRGEYDPDDNEVTLDTWWCEFCNEDVTVDLRIGEPLPKFCPFCGNLFPVTMDVP